MTASLALRLAVSFGFLAVALGAFGAHGLSEILEANGRVEVWKTAVLYHLAHAIVLLVISRWQPLPAAAIWSFTVGIVIFSGSLYVLALTNVTWLGAITPLGGLGLLAGWLLLLRAQ